MATTVKQTTLKTILTEEVTINGRARNSTVTKTINGIGEVFTNISDVTTAGTNLCQFASTKGAGVFSTAGSGAGHVKYIRISNLDDTNFVDITCSDHITAGSATNLFSTRLLAGKSFMLSGLKFDVATSDADNSIAAGTTIANIRGIADSASVDVEIVIASQ